MKKHFLALGAIAIAFFACKGGGDKFVGKWVGSMNGTSDTFNVTKDGDNYSLTDHGTKMAGTAKGDTLTVTVGGGMNVKFGYNNSTSQLSITVGPNTIHYDKK